MLTMSFLTKNTVVSCLKFYTRVLHTDLPTTHIQRDMSGVAMAAFLGQGLQYLPRTLGPCCWGTADKGVGGLTVEKTPIYKDC